MNSGAFRNPRRHKMTGPKADSMVASDPNSPKAKLTGRQKWVIAGLICLQVPSSAPLLSRGHRHCPDRCRCTTERGPLERSGSMPYSSAMKRKAAWQSGEEPESQHCIGAADPARATHSGDPLWVMTPARQQRQRVRSSSDTSTGRCLQRRPAPADGKQGGMGIQAMWPVVPGPSNSSTAHSCIWSAIFAS